MDPFLQKFNYWETLKTMAAKRKTAVYLVGGALRNYFVGRENSDFDFAVEKNALAFAKQFARQIKGAFILLDDKRFCARVAKKMQGKLFSFDFADYRAPTLRQDLYHRDFTINTLALDIAKLQKNTAIDQCIVDHNRGRKDIRLKKIRMVSPGVFKEDPLRLLRAFSLQATLGFGITRETKTQMKKDRLLIGNVSYERIRDELFKIFDSSRATSTVKAMDAMGLLNTIIPQIKVMENCVQGAYHHLDVWPHAVETLLQLEKLFDQLQKNKDIEEYLNVSIGGNRSRLSLIKLAALLHDIGKPDTKRIEKGHYSFHAHECIGKGIVKHIAKMIKLSTHERHALEDMVLWHLRPGYLSDLINPSAKAIYRYFRDTKEEAASILLLSLADQRATRGPATTLKALKRHEKVCFRLLEEFFTKKKEKPLVRLINGYDIKKHLKLAPSPLFGKILNGVEERQALGKIKTKKEALAFAKELASKAR